MDFVFLIPLIVMMAPVLIVLIALRYRYRQTQARYQTLLLLADKGVDLPAQLLVEPQVAYCERRRALVLIGGGLGLMMMVLALPGELDNGQRIAVPKGWLITMDALPGGYSTAVAIPRMPLNSSRA